MARTPGQINKGAVLGLGIAALFIGVTARAQTADLRPLSKALVELPDAGALLAVCPADAFDTETPGLARIFPQWEAVNGSACASDTETCLNRCLSWGSGEACTDLGILLETTSDEYGLAGRIAHARGCALGSAGGCTNRGGGIRNEPLPGDPLSMQPFPEKGACLFRTFNLACAANISWACAMLGQAYEFGEGIAADPLRARVAYERACLLAGDPDFLACVFADERLDRLNQTAGP